MQLRRRKVKVYIRVNNGPIDPMPNDLNKWPEGMNFAGND
jgi:hypothetical protein